MPTTLQPTALGQQLDTSPEAFGKMKSSIDIVGAPEILRERMKEDGYLYLPGLLEREEVIAARARVAELYDEAGILSSDFPAEELVPTEQKFMGVNPDIPKQNPALLKVLYDGAMMNFYKQFLGGEVRHFDYTWFRSVAPGVGTSPHMDIVYMGRGTHNLYTAWTPLGDIPIAMGGLMILENSHLHDRLNNNYGQKDVDKFCSNRKGEKYEKMGGGGNIASGGWLSKNPVKLRENLGGRWLTADFEMGDVVTFSMNTIHASIDNASDRLRISTDTRYQLASEPVDERWIGENPIAHGPEGKRGMIC